jgi:hypothetical protein
VAPVTAVITLAAVLAWALTSRCLFRRWMRDDTFWIGGKDTCSHGYKCLHADQPCHNMGEPAPGSLVAVIALAAGLVLPATLIVMFVMAGAPQGRREREERIRLLEEENQRLQGKYVRGPWPPPGMNPATYRRALRREYEDMP